MARIRVEYVACGFCSLNGCMDNCTNKSINPYGWYENVVHIVYNHDKVEVADIIVTIVPGLNGPEPRKYFRQTYATPISNSIGGLYYSPHGSLVLAAQVVRIHPEDIDLRPFLSIRTIDISDCVSLGLVYCDTRSLIVHSDYKGQITQVMINGMGTIVYVITHSEYHLSLASWNTKFYFAEGTRDYTDYDCYANWPEMSDIVTKCEYRWKSLTDRLINAYRLRHKMRPGGAFLKKLIERDTDFEK